MGKRKSSKFSSGGEVTTGGVAKSGGKGKRRNSIPPSYAHESDERRIQQLQNLEIKRLHNLVIRQENNMTRYIPPATTKRRRMDPNYQLKGAARPALEHYSDPNYEPEPEPIDLLGEYEGRLWEHKEGQILLERLLEYGIGLHNIGQKSKEAIKIFERMLQNDSEDHLVSVDFLL